MKKYFVFFCVFIVMSAYAELSGVKFPGTIDDLSFKSRMEIASDGYKPFLDKKAYQELEIVPGEEIFIDHMILEAEAEAKQQEQDAKNMNIDEYCKKYPYDETRCPQQSDAPQTQNNQLNTTPVANTNNTQPYSGYTIGGGQVIENNIVTGGSCYPADHDRIFKNEILTTGKYEKQYPAFEKALITIFRKEGRCGTIPGDPCGYTCYGIGSSPKCMGIVVHSRAEAEEIYYSRFWKKYDIYKLPDVIATDIMIGSMGSYIGTTMNQFRKMLGIPTKKSPKVDNEMINAVKNYRGDIHNDWLNVRDEFLQRVARERYNGSVSRGYKNGIELKRKNGCHVRPAKPLYRQ